MESIQPYHFVSSGSNIQFHLHTHWPLKQLNFYVERKTFRSERFITIIADQMSVRLNIYFILSAKQLLKCFFCFIPNLYLQNSIVYSRKLSYMAQMKRNHIIPIPPVQLQRLDARALNRYFWQNMGFMLINLFDANVLQDWIEFLFCYFFSFIYYDMRLSTPQ